MADLEAGQSSSTPGDLIRDRFVLLRIPSPGVPGPLDFAYTENEAELRYLDDKPVVAGFEQVWARLTGVALGFEETRRVMREVAGSDGNNGVEVWRTAESVVVRDSKVPGGGVVRVSPAAFDQWLKALGRY